MNSIDTLTTFLGWCTVINFGFLLFVSFSLTAMRRWVLRAHAWIFGLSEENLLRTYFQFVALYKIAIIVLNLVPYLALQMMA